MTRFGLTVDAVDLYTLSEALSDNNPGNDWWFNAESGDVRLGGDWTDGFADEDLEDQGWIRVDHIAGRAGFEDMELFAAAVGDVRARDVLQAALQGKGVFRRFRDTLREFPELKAPWQTWLAAREDARAIRWLLAGDHVDELDAEAHLKDLHQQAAEMLDQVRASGTPAVDIGDAPARWPEVLSLLERGEAVTFTRAGRAYAVLTAFGGPPPL